MKLSDTPIKQLRAMLDVAEQSGFAQTQSAILIRRAITSHYRGKRKITPILKKKGGDRRGK